ncbi:preprotein translocase subunit YajC [Bifidobacterium sp. ESL0763]|nr:preprotein translocase subunit YajC [Bifidobacterium sp. ESL0763]MDF7663825.1 preprotein translocase subunit YajC [Bifidobacterium sp. ESL0763]
MIFIVFLVLMVALMFWQSRKSKQQQKKVKDFRQSLQPGDLVQTIGGIIGKVVSVDTKYEEIVIDSDGSPMRFTFPAISKKYERPAFIDDDDVDEDGNPVDKDDEDATQATDADETAQKPFDTADEAQQDVDNDSDSETEANDEKPAEESHEEKVDDSEDSDK